MRFTLEGLEVFFPYEYIYPEQLDYMRELKVGLQRACGGAARSPPMARPRGRSTPSTRGKANVC